MTRTVRISLMLASAFAGALLLGVAVPGARSAGANPSSGQVPMTIGIRAAADCAASAAA